MRTCIRIRLAGMAALAMVGAAYAQTPLGTEFTYQGQLKQAGSPFNGNANFIFELFNAETGGAPLGTVVRNNLAVTDGLFTTLLDFGPAAFAGDALWLQVTVNGTPLSPRQPLTAAPYALKTRGIDGHSLDAPDGNPTDAVAVDNDGNLSVWNIIRAGGQLILGSNTPDYKGAFIIANGADWASDRGWLFLQHGDLTAPAPDSSVLFRYANNNNFTNQMIIRSSGNVGIGTMTPGQKLSVAGTVESTSGGFKFPDGSVQTAAASNVWAVSGDHIYASNSGNVGIGTPTPAFKLDLLSNGNGVARFRSTDMFGTVVAFENGAGGRNWSLISTGAAHGAGPGMLVFRDVNAALDRVVIDRSGNVGVGSASPQAALHVVRNPATAAGTLCLEGADHTYMSFYPDGIAAGRKAWFGFGTGTSNDIALRNEIPNGHIRLLTSGTGKTQVNVLEILGGADVAEPFDVNRDAATAPGSAQAGSAPDLRVEPGMVVCIDPKNPGELRVSTSAYDRTVAGVISGAGGVRTGMVLSQEDTLASGKHLVALTGRVYCYVDADAGGPIQPGDLLTTSDTPGHAMKATDHARATGAVIGKAMTALDRGRGLVLVLVNLQ